MILPVKTVITFAKDGTILEKKHTEVIDVPMNQSLAEALVSMHGITIQKMVDDITGEEGGECLGYA